MKKGKARRKSKLYAFIDTNIFLDFYRSRNETSLSLLSKLEQVKDRIICTYQVEMEFLKNRQTAVLENLTESSLKLEVQLPAVMDDSQLSAGIKQDMKSVRKRRAAYRKRVSQIIEKPSTYDPIYRVLKSLFISDAAHVLTRDMPVRRQIKRLAWRRFVLGYPPRKSKDTSVGDAFNWEWFVYCARQLRGRFIIVSKDGDYGSEYNGSCSINDALKAEFRDRVGKKSLRYTNKLSDALKQFEVAVTKEEEESESSQLQGGAKTAWPESVRDYYLRNMLANSSIRGFGLSQEFADKTVRLKKFLDEIQSEYPELFGGTPGKEER